MKTKGVLLFKNPFRDEPAKAPSEVKASTEADDFGEVFHRYQPLVRTVLFQIAGRRLGIPAQLNELEQEAFIKIWKALPEFRDQAKLTSWIYRITANVAIDALRASSRGAPTSQLESHELASPNESTESELANRQLVELGLSELSEEQRTVVVLALIHERPLEEIAEILEVSVGTVKSRLHYAKDHFRRILENRGIRL